jgi:hypothetical protein
MVKQTILLKENSKWISEMNDTYDGLYFAWLTAKLISPSNPTYRDLLKILYKTEFTWIILQDQNRAEDGRELREYFFNETKLPWDEEWYRLPVSVLEVLIGFSDRASFQTNEPVKVWFWRFIQNLGLDEFKRVSKEDREKVEEIIDRFIWRTYDDHGNGGLCPLNETKNDQRKVEIWYQFCEYVFEQGYF